MRIAICDDDNHYLQTESDIIKKHFPDNSVQIYSFKNKADFNIHFSSNPSIFDIIIIDIELPDANGIEMAAYIRKRNEQVRIIFLTNYLEYATEVYETEHTFYLLKKDAETRLPHAINKAIEQLKNIRNDFIAVDSLHNGKMIIMVNDIVYMERKLRTSYIYTENKSIETSENIEKIAERIKPGIMARIHQSYIVNMNHISSLKGKDVIFFDNRTLNITRNYSKSFKEDFMNFIKSEKV